MTNHEANKSIQRPLFERSFSLPAEGNMISTLREMELLAEWRDLKPNYLSNKSLSIAQLGVEKTTRIYELLNSELDLGKQEIDLGDNLIIKFLDEGQSSKVYSVRTKDGIIIAKVQTLTRPRAPLMHLHPKVVLGHVDSSGLYAHYADLRHYLTLPGEGREISFMEYGGEVTLRNKIQYRFQRMLKAQEIKRTMEALGFRSLPGEYGTKAELHNDKNYLLVKRHEADPVEVAAIDMPFFVPSEHHLKHSKAD
jgi:hypothetical protein